MNRTYKKLFNISGQGYYLIIACLFLLFINACSNNEDQHTHAGHGHEHNSHANASHDAHAHTDHDSNNSVTHFNDKTELFVEFPKLIKNQSVEFIVHLTSLSDFKPVSGGTVTITLYRAKTNSKESFSAKSSDQAGIFKVKVKPKTSGSRNIEIIYHTQQQTIKHAIGKFRVYHDKHQAEHGKVITVKTENAITYLKEQQWKFSFATSEVSHKDLYDSIPATGEIHAPNNNQVKIYSPVRGHINSVDNNFPYIGMTVKKGQILARIFAKLADNIDISELELKYKQAASKLNLATYERKRLERLYKAQAIAKKKLVAAENAEQVAQAEFQTIQKQIEQVSNIGSNQHSGIQIQSPLDGVIADVKVVSGSFVDTGEFLFHIINDKLVWLIAKVPESRIAKLSELTAAWFTIQGFKQTFDTRKNDGKIISIGNKIDSQTRTFPVIIELKNPGMLKIGMFAKVNLITKKISQALTIPASSVIDDNGESVVYVQLAGESFERRLVQTGIQDGEFIQILNGLKAKERVVSKGAYLLKLASSSPSEVGHGHAH